MPRVKLKLPRSWRFRSKKQFLFMLPAAIIVLIALSGASYAFFINGGSGPAASANSVNLSKGLVGEWKMDGNMKDSTPNGNDGVASNITVVQGPIQATASNQKTLTASWPAATTTGDTLVAIVTFNNGSGTITTPAGWIKRAESGTTCDNVYVWGSCAYEIVNAASRSGSETFTTSYGNDATLWLFELSGVNATTPDDVTSSYSGSSSDIKAMGPATLGSGAGIVFAVADTNGGCSSLWSLTSTGWMQDSGYRAKVGYRLVNGNQTVSAIWSAGCSWKGILFSFNAASAPGITSVADRKNVNNHAYNFGGTHHGINTPFIQSNVSAYTESAWIKFTDSSKNSTIVQDRGSGTGKSLTLALNTNNSGCPAIGRISYALDSTSTYIGIYTNNRYDDGAWHHVVGIWNGASGTAITPAQFSLYVDGAPASVSTCNTGAATAPVSGSGGTVIGYHQTWNGKYAGALDDVRIYNRAITADEAKALYHSYDDPLDIGQGEKGLVGWWKLDGNLTDATPYNTNCTAPTSSPSFVPDRKNNAIGAMNPPKLGLDCGQPTALQVSNVTMSAWVNPTSWNTSGNGIESFGGTVQLYFNSSGNLQFIIHDSLNQAHTFTSPSTYALGTWLHVAVTYDGTTVILYVNGVPVSTTSYTGGIGTNHYNDSGNDFMLGEYNAASTARSFKGSLDDVRIYNRALSPSEISNLYGSYNSQISLGGDGQANGINLQKGLVGYWPMNGNAKDSTPYSDNGTPNGATPTTDRKGRLNSAYSSTGNRNYISIPGSFLPTQSITVAAWVNLSSLYDWYDPVEMSNYLSYTGSWDLSVPVAGDVFFGIYTTSQQQTFCPNGSFTAGTWHQIAGTYDGTTVRVYLDGQQCGIGSLSGAILDNTHPLWIGDTDFSGVSSSFDDVRIYNRALSLAEVQALYQEYQ